MSFGLVTRLTKCLKVVDLIGAAACLVDDVVNVGSWRDAFFNFACLAKITIALEYLGA